MALALRAAFLNSLGHSCYDFLLLGKPIGYLLRQVGVILYRSRTKHKEKSKRKKKRHIEKEKKETNITTVLITSISCYSICRGKEKDVFVLATLKDAVVVVSTCIFTFESAVEFTGSERLSRAPRDCPRPRDRACPSKEQSPTQY